MAIERMEAMHDDQAELEEFGKRWAEAELAVPVGNLLPALLVAPALVWMVAAFR
jgi:hypothetical protein